MDKGDLAQLIVLSPEIRVIESLDEAQKHDWALDQIDLAVSRIVRSFDWDFAMDVADKAIEADEPDYQLTGNKNDCAHIQNIRLGETGGEDAAFTPLIKYTSVTADEYMVNHTVSTPSMWYLIKRKQNFPQVRILDTPDSQYEGYSLRYRYWIKGIRYENLDTDLFAEPIELYGRMKFNPGLMPLFKESLAFVISKYQPDGGQPNPAQMDSLVRKMNVQRRNLQGY